MKAGKVVQFRLFPDDCISVLDILDAADIERESKSFASCTSIAVKLLIKMAIDGNIISKPDPFSFSDRLATYSRGKNNVEKRKFSNVLYEQASKGLAIPTNVPVASLEDITYSPEVQKEVDTRVMQDKLILLNDKKEAGINLTPQEVQEYEKYISILY